MNRKRSGQITERTWLPAVLGFIGIGVLYGIYTLGPGKQIVFPIVGLIVIVLGYYYYEELGLSLEGDGISGKSKTPNKTEAIIYIHDELVENPFYFGFDKDEAQDLHQQGRFYTLNDDEKYVVGISGRGNKEGAETKKGENWYITVLWNWTDNHIIDFHGRQGEENIREKPLDANKELLKTEGYERRWRDDGTNVYVGGRDYNNGRRRKPSRNREVDNQ